MGKCKKCKWWHRNGAKYPENIPTWSKSGVCKKYPSHEKRNENDWCGEHENIVKEEENG